MPSPLKTTRQRTNTRLEEPPPSTRDQVYEFIRRAILMGEYPGGTFIGEEDISRRMGVSRTPVREALYRLHAEQYIDLPPRKGALVRQVTTQEVAGMYQARSLLEGSVIDLICRERIPVSDKIPTILEKMRAMKQVKTPDEQMQFIDLDWSLHCAMIEMSGNEVLVDLYKSLRSRYDRIVRTIQITPERVRRVYSEHTKILRLLESHDLENLRSTLREHLNVP